MLQFALSILAALRVFFRTRRDTALEVLALRQQVAVLKRKRTRPVLNSLDRLFRTSFRRMAEENAGWGAPKIHGELLKLGSVVSERTVARYPRRVRRRGDPAKRWLAFLQNHREVIVAFNFFTVPTATFQLLYCIFVIEHGFGTDKPLCIRAGGVRNNANHPAFPGYRS